MLYQYKKHLVKLWNGLDLGQTAKSERLQVEIDF